MIISLPNPLHRLPEMARRLGIEPVTDLDERVTLATGGVHYDVIELVGALLDRIEQVLPAVEAKGG